MEKRTYLEDPIPVEFVKVVLHFWEEMTGSIPGTRKMPEGSGNGEKKMENDGKQFGKTSGLVFESKKFKEMMGKPVYVTRDEVVGVPLEVPANST